VHPATGFHVASVHSIGELVAIIVSTSGRSPSPCPRTSLFAERRRVDSRRSSSHCPSWPGGGARRTVAKGARTQACFQAQTLYCLRMVRLSDTPAAHRRGERYFHIVGKPALRFSPPSPFRSFNAPPGPWRANGPDCSLANPKSLGCVGNDHLHLLAPLTSHAHVSCNSGVKRVL
jgi:hypothetical protein